MAMILRQSTAVTVTIGPFVDLTDGATSETGESPTVKISKTGGAMSAKNEGTTPSHLADGYYDCNLDATDTATVGTLVLSVAKSANALPVRHEFQVVEEVTYDYLYASGATPLVDVNAQLVDALNTDTYGEPSGAPGATVTLAEKIGRLYQMARNKTTVTASAKTFFDDAGSSLWSQTLSDDGATFTQNEGS